LRNALPSIEHPEIQYGSANRRPSAKGGLITAMTQQQSGHTTTRHDRIISITEAVMLSMVALFAAWSGYCAASWDTEASNLLSQSLEAQVAGQAATQEGLQVRTFDSVSFDAAFSAYIAQDRPAFDLAVKRLRPGYRKVFNAWVALKPLKNPKAPADPSLLPQYKIAQEARGRELTAEAHTTFDEATAAGNHSDKYVRLTVLFATVLFLLGISGHFPIRSARYALIGIGSVLIVFCLISMLSLPGPPA
jgi:hypothetical protein